MKEVIIAVSSALLGTILGWMLNLITNKIGKIYVNIAQPSYDFTYGNKYENSGWLDNGVIDPKYLRQYKDRVSIGFEVVAYNNKMNICGIDDCKLYIEYGNGIITQPNSIFGEEVNNLDELLNIEAKTTKKAQYRMSEIMMTEEMEKSFKVYLEYKINGKKRRKKKLHVMTYKE